jgi:hypothetical protein
MGFELKGRVFDPQGLASVQERFAQDVEDKKAVFLKSVTGMKKSLKRRLEQADPIIKKLKWESVSNAIKTQIVRSEILETHDKAATEFVAACRYIKNQTDMLGIYDVTMNGVDDLTAYAEVELVGGVFA